MHLEPHGSLPLAADTPSPGLTDSSGSGWGRWAPPAEEPKGRERAGPRRNSFPALQIHPVACLSGSRQGGAVQRARGLTLQTAQGPHPCRQGPPAAPVPGLSPGPIGPRDMGPGVPHRSGAAATAGEGAEQAGPRGLSPWGVGPFTRGPASPLEPMSRSRGAPDLLSRCPRSLGAAPPSGPGPAVTSGPASPGGRVDPVTQRGRSASRARPPARPAFRLPRPAWSRGCRVRAPRSPRALMPHASPRSAQGETEAPEFPGVCAQAV